MSYRIVGFLLLGLTSFASAASADVEWETNVEDARQIAQRDGKDLFVYFTSSGGCVWCRVLERVVLETEEFAKAKEDFVLVKLDIPFDETQIEKEERARNIAWKERWGATGYPTIVLADVDARPFGWLFGHQPDGPVAVLKRLEAARSARMRRDELFAIAEDAQPATRAELFDEALSALPLEREIVARIYRSEVEAVIAGTRDAALRGRYRRMLAAEEDRLFQQEVKQKILATAGPQVDSKLAIEVLDELLAEPDLSESRRDWLLVRKAIYRFTEGAYAEAEAALGAAVEGEDLSESPSTQIFRGRMMILSGQVMHGVAFFDRLAGALIELPEERLNSVIWKAEALAFVGKPVESLMAYNQALAAAWRPQQRISCQWGRSKRLIDLSRPDEAAAACRDALSAIRKQGSPALVAGRGLLRLADALRATGDTFGAAIATESARRLLNRDDPDALTRTDIKADLSKSPPIDPVEAARYGSASSRNAGRSGTSWPARMSR